MCNFCGRKGHLERTCDQKKKYTDQKNGKLRGFGNRVQFVDQEEIDDEDEDEDKDVYMVLNVEGGRNEAKPFYMEGFINGNRFKTMIDTGYPVTIFALDEIKTIMKKEKLPVRQMIEGERYVDFNGKPLRLLGYVFCEMQVNDSYNKKARILIARSGTKSIIGREWLTTLRYKLELQTGELDINSIEKISELIVETRQLVTEFPELFKRQGKVNSKQLQNKKYFEVRSESKSAKGETISNPTAKTSG